VRFLSLSIALLALSACSISATSRSSYLVFFQERSAKLDTDADKVIALVAQHAKEQPAAPVDVIGYTDSAGSPPADVRLSQQRAQAVSGALVANGVAANRVVPIGLGPTGEDPGLASRRVEIAIAGD
jgi:outer membrane protein OmpA-like peptidoglycan-associated protein